MDYANFYKQGAIGKGKPLVAKIPVPADGGMTRLITQIHYQNADNPDFAGTLDYEVVRDWGTTK